MKYRVKVLQNAGIPPTYIYGGSEITFRYDMKLYLAMRVDELGEPVILKAYDATDSQVAVIGKLKPGECFVISLNEITGVSAETNADTHVDCEIVSQIG